MKTRFIILFLTSLFAQIQAQTRIIPQKNPEVFWQNFVRTGCNIIPGPEVPGYDSLNRSSVRAFVIHSEDYNVPIYCLEADTACLRPESLVNRSYTEHPSLPPGKIWLLRFENGGLLKKSDIRNLLKYNELPIPPRRNGNEK